MTDLRSNRWQLPDGVNELLPKDAWCVEALRRQIMDNAWRWGYELVMPPMIEYLDSLLTGTGEQLDLQTFKIIDQHNGRSLGIRADMTPQVARIDAHALRRDMPNRLFYIGSVLRARTDGAGSSRTPLQFGAELFGHAGPESDAEIIQLMVENVLLAGVVCSQLVLDVGHVGVYRALIEEAGLPIEHEKQLFDALLRGSYPEVVALLQSYDNTHEPSKSSAHITALLQLSGDSGRVLANARTELASAGSAVQLALDNLQAVIDKVHEMLPDVAIHIDLAELRGFSYHTGILFTLFDKTGIELARGGRYDAIGEAFGHARPATGFSGDLVGLTLAHHSTESERAALQGIWVPGDDNGVIAHDALLAVGKLRSEGERVVLSLPRSELDAAYCGCDRQLVLRDGCWTVELL